VLSCFDSANVSEAAASRRRKAARPIRAANSIYSAREENVRRKVTDVTDPPLTPSRNLIANQKTKIVSSELDICSSSARRRGQSRRVSDEEAGMVAGIFDFSVIN
jgi:hypothetical protein